MSGTIMLNRNSTGCWISPARLYTQTIHNYQYECRAIRRKGTLESPERRVVLMVNDVVRFVEARNVQQPMHPAHCIKRQLNSLWIHTVHHEWRESAPVKARVFDDVENQELE